MNLFPYQSFGADWLSRKGVALLADEMGLGKSAQAITASDLVGAQRILVICPAVARENWKREFEKFESINRMFHVIYSGNETVYAYSTICSYEYATTNREKLLQKYDVLILDEVHFLKSTGAKRTAAVLGKDGICRQAKRIWCLSGTPMPSHPGELWVLLYTFGRTKLTYMAFIQHFCSFAAGKGPYSGQMQITGARKETIPELRALLQPIMLRRKKDQVMKELPSITFENVVVTPDPKIDFKEFAGLIQWAFPTDRTKEFKEVLETETSLLEKSFKTNRWLELQANSVSTLRRYNGIQKIDAVSTIVEWELLKNYYKKIVIFAIHQDVIERLRRNLEAYNPVTLYGKTPPKRRQRNMDMFQSNSTCRVFIGNIRAAGTAITLTAANQVMFVEQEWTPGENAQAAMRCHRIGQTQPVTVRFVSIANSIDEKIANVLMRKTQDITAVLDAPVDIFS